MELGIIDHMAEILIPVKGRISFKIGRIDAFVVFALRDPGGHVLSMELDFAVVGR